MRLMGCNLSCEWSTPDGPSRCDEAQTWDAERYDLHAQGIRMDAAEIAAKALSYGTGMVVVTGGEPLLHQHQEGWAEMMGWLLRGGRVEVETNGTIAPQWPLADQYNVSPKLASAGQGAAAHRAEVIAAFLALGRAVFKFVAATDTDVEEAAALATGWGIPARLVWIMPVGTAPAVILQTAGRLAPAVATAGFNLTLRQQWLIHPGGEPR